MRSSIRGPRIPFRNSMREFLEVPRVASDQRRSISGRHGARRSSHARRGLPEPSFFHSQLSFISTVRILFSKLRAAGGKAGHGGRQADVPAQRAHLDHQLVALLEQPHLAFRGEWQLEGRTS